MAMTRREKAAKEQLLDVLYADGYGKTYGTLLKFFDIHLTKDPDVVAYMNVNRAEITINENLNIDQVSMVVRHEILHEWLTHKLRLSRLLGRDIYKQFMDMTPEELAQVQEDDELYKEISNEAGDYEISNLGYTDKDKYIAKHLKLNGKEVQGLVTDIDHPEWVNYTFEEIFKELEKELAKKKKNPPQPQPPEPPQPPKPPKEYSPEFVEAYTKIINKYDDDKYPDEFLQKLSNALLSGKVSFDDALDLSYDELNNLLS